MPARTETPSKIGAIIETAYLNLQYAEVHGTVALLSTIFIPLNSWLFVPSLFKLLFPHWAVIVGWLVTGVFLSRRVAQGCSGATTEELFPSSLPMRGKTVIITGAATGIGKANVLDFARLGASGIVVAARGDASRVAGIIADAKAAAASLGTNPTIVHLPLDLASFDSVRAFVTAFRAQFTQLDVLVNNAGVMFCDYTTTADGLEMQMGTNHFGHFLLTYLLEDMIRASKGRVVILSSNANHFGGTGIFYEYNSKRATYNKYMAYGQSKMMNVLHARALNNRLRGSGATAYSVHPGAVATELARHVDKSAKDALVPMYVRWQFLKTAENGAKTTVFCSHHARAVPGEYHSDCHVSTPSRYGLSDENAEKLWQLSEQVCGISSSSSSSTS